MNEGDYKPLFVIRALGFLMSCWFLQIILLLEGSICMEVVPGNPSKDSYCESTAPVCTEYLHYVLKMMGLVKISSGDIAITWALHRFCSTSAWPYQHEPYQVTDVFFVLFPKLGLFLSPPLSNDSKLRQKFGLMCQLAGKKCYRLGWIHCIWLNGSALFVPRIWAVWQFQRKWRNIGDSFKSITV